MFQPQVLALVSRLGLQDLQLPILLPGVPAGSLPLAPALTAKDEKAVQNVVQLVNFLTGGSPNALSLGPISPSMAQEVRNNDARA